MNIRQLRLKNMIDSGNVPNVKDATGIWDEDETKIPFHWGDLEIIGYGYTTRYFDERRDEKLLTRHYTGPGVICLMPQDVHMKNGDHIGD
jgi:hypothetical protein